MMSVANWSLCMFCSWLVLGALVLCPWVSAQAHGLSLYMHIHCHAATSSPEHLPMFCLDPDIGGMGKLLNMRKKAGLTVVQAVDVVDKVAVTIDGLHTPYMLTNAPPQEGQLPAAVLLHGDAPAWNSP